MIGASSTIRKLAFSPDARFVFAVTTESRLEKYDVASGLLVGGVPDVHRGDCHALAVSADGALVATGGSDRLVRVGCPVPCVFGKRANISGKDLEYTARLFVMERSGGNTCEFFSCTVASHVSSDDGALIACA